MDTSIKGQMKMNDSVSAALVQSVVDSQKDLIVIFENGTPCITNKSFNEFFSVSSCEEFLRKSANFVDNFIPHPSYFHKEKMPADGVWFDEIEKLPEIDRVVSMMTKTYEAHAYSVSLDRSVDGYVVATFSDITDSLIKRIMIESNANMDSESGAYAREYFLQISRSYQDAAVFNEKIIGAIEVEMDAATPYERLEGFVERFKRSTRQEDMLIRWEDKGFLVVFLVDNETNAHQMLTKLKNMSQAPAMQEFSYDLKLFVQEEDESIKALIKRLEE